MKVVGSHGSQSNNPTIHRRFPSFHTWDWSLRLSVDIVGSFNHIANNLMDPRCPPKTNWLQKIYGLNFETKKYTKSSFFGEVERIKSIFWSSISDISKTPAIAQVKAYSTIIPEIWPMDVSRAWLLRQLQQWGSSKIWAPPKSLKNVRWKIMFLLKWSPFVAPPAFKKKMNVK